MPRSLTSFPSSIAQAWDALFDGRLPLSPPDDPCNMPQVAFLSFPSRHTAEQVRYQLTHYRAAVRAHAKNFHLKNEARQDLALSASRMDSYRIRIRNISHPTITAIGKVFHSLPDGPHNIYFFPIDREVGDFTSQFLSAGRTSQAPRSAPNLTSLGYGTDETLIPLEDLEDLEPNS